MEGGGKEEGWEEGRGGGTRGGGRGEARERREGRSPDTVHAGGKAKVSIVEMKADLSYIEKALIDDKKILVDPIVRESSAPLASGGPPVAAQTGGEAKLSIVEAKAVPSHTEKALVDDNDIP